MSKIGVTFRGFWASISVISLYCFCNAVHGQFQGNHVQNLNARGVQKTLANIFRNHRDFQAMNGLPPPGSSGNMPEMMNNFPRWNQDGRPPMSTNEFQMGAAHHRQPEGPMGPNHDRGNNAFFNPLNNDIPNGIQDSFNNFNRPPVEGNNQRFPRGPQQNRPGFPVGPPPTGPFQDGPPRNPPFQNKDQPPNRPFQSQGPPLNQPFPNHGQPQNVGFLNDRPRNPQMFQNGPDQIQGGAPKPANVDNIDPFLRDAMKKPGVPQNGAPMKHPNQFPRNAIKESGPPHQQMKQQHQHKPPMQQQQPLPQQHQPSLQQHQPPQQHHQPPQQRHQSPQQHKLPPQQHQPQLQQHQPPPQQHQPPPQQHQPPPQQNQPPQQHKLPPPQQQNQMPQQQQQNQMSQQQQRNHMPHQQQQHQMPPQQQQNQLQQQQIQTPHHQHQQQNQQLPNPQQQQNVKPPQQPLQQQQPPLQHQQLHQQQQPQQQHQQQQPQQQKQQQSRFHRQPDMPSGFDNGFPPNQILRPPHDHDQNNQNAEVPQGPFSFRNHADAPQHHQMPFSLNPNGQFDNNFSERPRKNPGNQQRGPPPPLGFHQNNMMQEMPFKDQNFQEENVPFTDLPNDLPPIMHPRPFLFPPPMPPPAEAPPMGNHLPPQQSQGSRAPPMGNRLPPQQNQGPRAPSMGNQFNHQQTQGPRAPPMGNQLPPQQSQVPKIFSDFPSKPELDRGPWIPITSRPDFDWRPSVDGRWPSETSEEVSSSATTSNGTDHAEASTIDGQSTLAEDAPGKQSDKDQQVFESELSQNNVGFRSNLDDQDPTSDLTAASMGRQNEAEDEQSSTLEANGNDPSPSTGSSVGQKTSAESTLAELMAMQDSDLLSALGSEADLESLLNELQQGSKAEEPSGAWYRNHVTVSNRHSSAGRQTGDQDGGPLPFDKHFRSSLTPSLRDMSVDQLLNHFQTKFDEGLLKDGSGKDMGQKTQAPQDPKMADQSSLPQFEPPTTSAPPQDWSQRTLTGSLTGSDPQDYVAEAMANQDMDATQKPEPNFDGQLHSPPVSSPEATDSPNSIGEYSTPEASSRADMTPTSSKSTRPLVRRRKFPKRTVVNSKLKRRSTAAQ